MWETLSGTLMWFLDQWGELALFLIFLVEEAGVPLPLPGDLALIWAGHRVATGQSGFITVLLVVELATALGASALYWLGRRGGRPLILRYAHVLHLDEARLRRAERWVGHNAPGAIFAGRVVPGFRIVTPLAAGVFRVPYLVFLPALLAGTLVDAGFWMGVGLYLGPGALAALRVPGLTARLVLSAALLGALVLLTWRIRRLVSAGWRQAAGRLTWDRRLEAGALAGLLATLEMAAAVGVLLTALLALGVEGPERALLHTFAAIASGHGTLLGPAFVPVAGVLFFLAGILWALPYALWLEPRLVGPDWLRGALFSLVPTAVAWLVVLPGLGAGPFGLGLGAGLVPAAGELVRHLLYGTALGLVYPMLVLARRPRDIRAARLRPALRPAG
jgi:membrane protein DedA with SNARE-associated domain